MKDIVPVRRIYAIKPRQIKAICGGIAERLAIKTYRLSLAAGRLSMPDRA
jgi:hypothetical protein